MNPADPSVWEYFREFILVEGVGNKALAFAVLTGLALAANRFSRGLAWQNPLRRHVRALLLTGFVAGLLLRLAWVAWVPHVPSSEEVPLLEMSKDLADGKGFIYNGQLTARRSFGYVVFVALLQLLHVPLAGIQAANAVLSAAVGLMLFALGREIRGIGTGLLASILWALFPTSIFASSIITDEHLCLPLMLLGLYFALRHLKNPRWAYLAYTGLCLGLAALARPIPSVFPAAIFLCYWITRFSFWESLKRAAFVAAIIVLCAAPWAVRNWIKMGAPVFYCISQYGFYWANNSSYDVRFPVNPTPQAGEDPEIVHARDLYHAGGKGEIIYSQVAQRKAWEWITGHPALFLKKTIGKTLHLLSFSQEEWAMAANFQALTDPAAMPDKRLAEWAMIKPQNWAYVLVFFCALGGLGIFLWSWTQGNLNAPLLLLFLAAGQILVMTVLYLAHLKYRYMLDPFLLLSGSYYLCFLAHARRATGAAP